ncbi:MAG TPA: DHA2 family efflux MFS transporter permease subunit [Stellaceae bacterium]|nr:DHA2 family efflux MFS transporter permease subunit [Stellaceae bacterium]
MTTTFPVRVKTWIGFTAMAVGMFMAILDIQIVASSLPEIQAGLGIPLDRLSWVQTAYLMAEIVAIPLTGWLTLMLSTRGAFVICVAGFTAASLACAISTGFSSLIPARLVQGFCGGALIPLVFSTIFLMFDRPARPRATLVAGLFAMLAPTLGPVVGGFVTDRLSWHWLFLINVPPGIVVAVLVAWAVDVDRIDRGRFALVDLKALPLLAGFLAGLELLLKEAPQRGWSSVPMLLLAALSVVCGGGLVRRSLSHPRPLIDLYAFRDRNFAIGCCFSFALGIGLYGATYLLPVFLGLVRDYDALPIGKIMMVTGAAQLAMAPVATRLERRLDARKLIAVGYALLALGWLGNGFMTFATDFWGLFWQQLARGAAVMLCLLPSTALALGGFEPDRVANASGLFNLMRNLGGAIGLALIDTVLEARAPAHVASLVARLQAGDAAAARLVGLPTGRFTGVAIGPVDQATRDLVAPLVERAGLVAAFNDAWLWLGAAILLPLLLVPLLRATSLGLAAARPITISTASGKVRTGSGR